MELSINILRGVFAFIALLMVLVILMQRPKSEGLGAAFGGGVTENIFGAQTTNVLTKITSWLAAFFFILTFALSILYAHKGNSRSNLSERVKEGTSPAPISASPTPSPTPAVAAAATSPTASPSPSSTVDAVPPTSISVEPFASPVSSASPTDSAAPSATPPVRAKRRPRR